MIKHGVSRSRSENHIEITISVGEHEDVKVIRKTIQKTIRQCRHLLNGNLSFEYQIVDESKEKLIDQTIKDLCRWIQDKAQIKNRSIQGEEIPEMVRALAALITAREKN